MALPYHPVLADAARCRCDIEIPAVLKRFTADRPFWTVVEVSREVLTSAETFAAAHPLRALDAIHVDPRSPSPLALRRRNFSS